MEAIIVGVDLTLIPERYPEVSGKPLAYSRLALGCRNYALWDALTDAGTRLPSGIQWYSDEGVQERAENPYGEPITFVTAAKFTELWDQCCRLATPDDWDLAVASFVRSLPADRRLFLWFH